MLRLYPSNKLEHLVDLLSAVIQHTETHSSNPLEAVLSPTTIIVESLGMQHWLNMSLAQRHGVAMNLDFPMPTRFMWQVARQLLGEDLIPQQSTYKREILVWRLFALVQQDAVMMQPEMQAVRDYVQQLNKGSAQGEQAKVFDFCRAVADVYEQYMLYRPDWLVAWEKGLSMLEGYMSEPEARWQSYLWRLLVQQQPYHPANLHAMAVEALKDGKGIKRAQLPAHLFVFSLNTMAPQLVNFLDALAEYVDIHVFHLNPCVNYWGDFQTRRQQARELQLANWLNPESPNPILADMGQQGRDLFNLLQQQQAFEISAFEAPNMAEKADQPLPQPNLLHELQQAIFEGKYVAPGANGFAQDESITVVSAHSALRELQGLHDHLLSLFERDPNLHPQDVLVMCPAIEDYAAFIPAVFSTHRTFDSDPRIPCSVADRAPLDSVPEVAAFMHLLELPDSRFEVSAVIDFLRLDAIQTHFELTGNELDLLINWIEQARIHWGLSAQHQQTIVEQVNNADSPGVNGLYSWEWGLERLLTGLAHIDTPVFIDPIVTIPDVEGQQALALGKLCLLLEQLQEHRKALLTPRTADDWQQYLHSLKHSFFGVLKDNTQAALKIDKAIAELHEHALQAHFDEVISIEVLRLAFKQRFSSPDAINQFMTGQVTFCSMLPMRSIPFKVIAMLGMNDGQYPRQSIPISFDLMTKYPRRLGDRSRRGDDRYLFLEAIISARQQLYLSFQGKHIRDNSERQPSLVLRELFDYLRAAYSTSKGVLPYKSSQMPLHAFAKEHFDNRKSDVIASFDTGWLRLAELIQTGEQAKELNVEVNDKRVPSDSSESRLLSVASLVKALKDPLRYFANTNLGLYLDDRELELNDAEPFGIGGLERYQLLSEYINEQISGLESDGKTDAFADALRRSVLAGEIPADPITQERIMLIQPYVDKLVEYVQATETVPEGAHVSIGNLTLHTQTMTKKQAADESELFSWLPSVLRAEHHVLHRLQQLVTAASQGVNVTMQAVALDSKSDPIKLQLFRYPTVSPNEAKQQLEQVIDAYQSIEQQPLLWHIELGEAVCKTFSKGEPTSEELLRQLHKVITQEPFGLAHNPYYQWFFPAGKLPEQTQVARLLALYERLFVQSKAITVKDV